MKTYTKASCHLLWIASADPHCWCYGGDSAVLAEALTFLGGERALGRLKVDWLTVQSRRAPDVLPRWYPHTLLNTHAHTQVNTYTHSLLHPGKADVGYEHSHSSGRSVFRVYTLCIYIFFFHAHAHIFMQSNTCAHTRAHTTPRMQSSEV